MYMVYAELGRHPISITIHQRMLSFWSLINNGKKEKRSALLYKYMLYKNDKFKWLQHIKTVLSNIGRFDIWPNQQSLQINVNHFAKQILNDQFILQCLSFNNLLRERTMWLSKIQSVSKRISINFLGLNI